MSNQVTNLAFKDGDGGGEEGWEPASFNIDVVSNGYVLLINYADGDELKEVHLDINAVFKRIKEII
jgi:hypothetical protein